VVIKIHTLVITYLHMHCMPLVFHFMHGAGTSLVSDVHVTGPMQNFLLEQANLTPVKGNSLPNMVMTFFSLQRLRCAAFMVTKRTNITYAIVNHQRNFP